MSDDPWAEFNPTTPQPMQQAQPDVFKTGADPWASFTPQPAADKYRQAAIEERNALLTKGAALPEGFTRRLASGPFLGWGDEITAGALSPIEALKRGVSIPEGYRYAKAREDLAGEIAKQKTGLPGDIAETVGMLATGPTNVFGRQAAARLGGGGTGARAVAARMAGYGAESAALGALQGAGEAPNVDEMGKRALAGGVLGGALGAPFGAFANVARRSTAAVPTEQELFDLGQRAYRARDRMNVAYASPYVRDKLDDIEYALARKYGRDVPKAREATKQFADELHDDITRAAALGPGWQASVAPRDITSIRKGIYEAGAAGKPVDEAAGSLTARIVDRLMSRPNAAALSRGTLADAQRVAALDAQARGNWGAAARSGEISNIIRNTAEDAGATYSGLNFENRLRQNLKSAKRKEELGGFTAGENADLERLILGTTKANQLREFGNLLGGGGGLGRLAVMGAGGAGGGALGAYYSGENPWLGAAGGLAAGTAGRMMRTAANRRIERDAMEFAENLRRRSPEFTSRAARAPTEIGPGLTSPTASALRNTLTLGGAGDLRDAIAASILYNATGNRS